MVTFSLLKDGVLMPQMSKRSGAFYWRFETFWGRFKRFYTPKGLFSQTPSLEKTP
jgi:hypothetical protein